MTDNTTKPVMDNLILGTGAGSEALVAALNDYNAAFTALADGLAKAGDDAAAELAQVRTGPKTVHVEVIVRADHGKTKNVYSSDDHTADGQVAVGSISRLLTAIGRDIAASVPVRGPQLRERELRATMSDTAKRLQALTMQHHDGVQRFQHEIHDARAEEKARRDKAAMIQVTNDRDRPSDPTPRPTTLAGKLDAYREPFDPSQQHARKSIQGAAASQ